MLDANNDLLANVATLGKADRVVQICFCNDVRLIHVASKNSDAGLDPQYLQCVVADRLGPGLAERIPQVCCS
jgi:hypothetical protein